MIFFFRNKPSTFFYKTYLFSLEKRMYRYDNFCNKVGNTKKRVICVNIVNKNWVDLGIKV